MDKQLNQELLSLFRNVTIDGFTYKVGLYSGRQGKLMGYRVADAGIPFISFLTGLNQNVSLNIADFDKLTTDILKSVVFLPENLRDPLTDAQIDSLFVRKYYHINKLVWEAIDFNGFLDQFGEGIKNMIQSAVNLLGGLGSMDMEAMLADIPSSLDLQKQVLEPLKK